jgi:hypothetical protein
MYDCVVIARQLKGYIYWIYSLYPNMTVIIVFTLSADIHSTQQMANLLFSVCAYLNTMAWPKCHLLNRFIGYTFV